MRRDQPLVTTFCRLFFGRSPHAQGSTASGIGPYNSRLAFPACAGINRDDPWFYGPYGCVPRMRRDQPAGSQRYSRQSMRSPHAQGSTEFGNLQCAKKVAFPACAGINRIRRLGGAYVERVPRMRRDQPLYDVPGKDLTLRSPHAQGSTAGNTTPRAFASAFPACAGINRWHPLYQGPSHCVPRMRRDQPARDILRQIDKARSPHAQGSTAETNQSKAVADAFPACAGINRKF